MNFNLGNNIPATSKAGAPTRLKANEIHDVTFEGAVAEVIEKKDGSESFNVLKLKFKNADGLTFEDTIFEPREADTQRKPSGFGYDNPSNMEELLFKIKHLITAIAPEVAKKIEEKGINVSGWDEFRKFVVTNTTKAKGAATQIKLVADKDNNARFPGFVLGITKAGEVYPRTNFIGAKLNFTAKELERIEARTSAKSTDMSTKVTDNTVGTLDINIGGSEDELALDLSI